MTFAYRPTPADHASKPSSFDEQERYLGYREADERQPYASFFEPRTAAIQDAAAHALLQGMAPTEWGVGLDGLVEALERPGREPLENGWTRVGARTYVAVTTAMPGCTAAMWHWWFGWHSRESARYKLWNPDAHQFCTLGQDRGGNRELSDEDRYVGNVSYVDEYIGGRMQRLAIRFVDPVGLGFSARPGRAHVCARVGFSRRPLSFGWLVHQVRPTSEGCEMRSRFVLNDPTLGRDGQSVLRLPPRLSAAAMPTSIGPDMLYHCAAEMNHLARFLPALHAEFHDVP